MKKQILIFLILHFCISSCKDANEEIKVGKLLDFDVEKTKVEPTDFVNISYLVLENNLDYLISSADQIEYTDKYIFILNCENNRLNIYDRSGSFIGTVGRKGRAEGELLWVESFYITENNEKIGILDLDTEKMNYYSAEYPFKYISNKNVSYPDLYNIEFNENKKLFSLNTNPNPNDIQSRKHFLVLDEEFNIINSFNDKEFVSGYIISTRNSIYKIDDDIFGYSLFDNVVYKLTEKGTEPFYTIKFGENTIPPIDFFIEDIGENNESLFSKLFESDYVSMFFIYETKDNMCITYNVGRDKKEDIGFFNKKTNNIVCYSQKYFANIMQIGTFTSVSGIINNSYVMPMESELVKMDIKKGKPINKELAELVSNVSDGTMILALIEVK